MSLKIKPEDLERLKSAVLPLDTLQLRERYLAGTFHNSDKYRDVDMRYRWDLLQACGLKLGDGRGTTGDIDLYAYLDDDHIDSALRAIVPSLKSPSKEQSASSISTTSPPRRMRP